MFKNFQVSVDVFPMGIVQGWGSLVHIGLGGDNSVYGDRYPAIWFSPNSLQLYIASAINGNKDHITKKIILADTWTTIVVQQQKGQFFKPIIIRERDKKKILSRSGLISTIEIKNNVKFGSVFNDELNVPFWLIIS